MTASLHDINSYFCHKLFALVGILLLVSTLCVVASFFMVVVLIGTASTAVYALASRWDRSRGRRGAPARRNVAHSQTRRQCELN